MVLKIAEAAVSSFFPTQYTVHIGVAIVTILLLRAFSQGRRTTRERDLHARTIVVTGGFTPIGLTLLNDLAKRGAHIIALSPEPIEDPRTSILIELLRSTTSNEHIFAEHCDLSSPSSIRAFCTKFLTGEDTRVDALVFAHEYRHLGALSILECKEKGQEVEEQRKKEREASSLATFLITTLLLPALLVAPVERDIRIVNVVNPFYAAAASTPSLSPSALSPSSAPLPRTPRDKKGSLFLTEGARALRAIILTRHLQRILDALPSAQVPKTDLDLGSTVPVVSSKAQKSNIVAISVSPGISRLDTVSGVLNADWTRQGFSYLGVLLYFILQPFFRIFTKSPASSIQSVLHVLFLPTPFKVLAQTTFASTDSKTKNTAPPTSLDADMPEEVLKPGALYGECAVVKLRVPPPTVGGASAPDTDTGAGANGKGPKPQGGKGKGNAKAIPEGEEALELEDDGEYGGELAGRVVWEAYEEALRAWEKENPNPVPEETVKPKEGAEGKAPDVDRPSGPGVS